MKIKTSVDVVEIDYTNWRGERATRRITPVDLFFGANEWHKSRTWLLKAFDHRQKAFRTFAMSNIHSWTEVAVDRFQVMGKNDGQSTEQAEG